MRRVYLVPNIITAFGLACGLFVIFKVNMIEPGSGHYEVMLSSALLLLVAAIADFIDGALARAFRAETEFGFFFDSIADSVSFGVAPSVLLLKSLSLEQGTLLSFLGATGAMVYSLCGVLRLVRFNVKGSKPKEKAYRAIDTKKHFTGLPVPAGAAAVISANLFFLFAITKGWFVIEDNLRVIILTCINLLIGYFMLSRWKFPSLKVLHFRILSFHLAFLTVVIAIFFLYGILYYFPIILAAVAWSYILVALILSLIRLIAGKKSKTLQDFEPEPDDFDVDE